MAISRKCPINLILGAGNIGDKLADPMARFDTPDEVDTFLNVYSKQGYRQIDTSRMYSPHAPNTSEPRLGAVAAGARFIIDTKVMSREAGSHTKAKILSEIDLSLDALKIKQINVEFLHAPDRATPFEEACEAMDQAIKEGKIKKWGLSNYTAAEVQQFIDICEARDLVKPSVYEGLYNPIVRGNEKSLFPLLRKHGMAFYAFSPTAGGFFSGSYKNAQSGGRFDKSLMIGFFYSNLFLKPAIMAATDKAIDVAIKHGISSYGAAIRWTVYHGVLSDEYGDAVILGASSPQQLESTLNIIEEGPLPDEVAAAMNAVYEAIGPEDEVAYHS